MRYKCLVLDHDDTAVDSTASIHYPCFVEYLEKFYPQFAGRYSLSEYFRKNFVPGIVELFRDELGFSAEELAAEEAFWAEYVKGKIPRAYPGIRELLCDYIGAGGILVVDSHSYTENILRDYRENGLPTPARVYGWDLPPACRKPSPYTVLEVMKDFHLSADEVLAVDDLKPGYDMARAAGVDFAASGWAYDVPEIEAFMREHSDRYCKSVDDLRRVLLEE